MSKSAILVTGVQSGEYLKLAKLLEDTYDLIHYPDIEDALLVYEIIFSRINTIIYFVEENNVEDNKKIINKFKTINPLAEIIIITNQISLESAVEYMKMGATDYMTKPYLKTSLLAKLNLAFETENAYKRLGQMLNNQLTKKNIVGIRIKEIMDNLISKIIRGEEINEKKLKDTLGIELSDTLIKKMPKVLIVEDDPHLGPLIKKILDIDFKSDLAEDAERSLSLVRDNKDYDVILLDIFLPDISGEKLLPKLKEVIPQAEVIVITAYKIVEIAIDTLQHGAFDYVNKPIDEEDLLNKVRKAIRSKIFKSLIPKLPEAIISESFSKDRRIKVTEDIYFKKKKRHKPFRMADIYLFFPELRESHISEKKVLSPKILDDGMRLFIEKIEDKISKQADK